MGDHLPISGGLLQAPLNPLKTDVSRGPPGLSGGPGPLGPHRNSTTAHVTALLSSVRSALSVMSLCNITDELLADTDSTSALLNSCADQ